jgi:hypothetical protein
MTRCCFHVMRSTFAVPRVVDRFSGISLRRLYDIHCSAFFTGQHQIVQTHDALALVSMYNGRISLVRGISWLHCMCAVCEGSWASLTCTNRKASYHSYYGRSIWGIIMTGTTIYLNSDEYIAEFWHGNHHYATRTHVSCTCAMLLQLPCISLIILPNSPQKPSRHARSASRQLTKSAFKVFPPGLTRSPLT